VNEPLGASLPPLMTRYPAPVRRGLADQLVEHLIAAILGGDHPPDSQLPPEGKLAELFDVSRLTVREAVKALRNKGIVRVEQGRGTFVNRPSLWSPLDPDLLMARAATAEGREEVATKLTEARRLVEVGVAMLAAQRRTDADLAALDHALDRMRKASDRGDVDGFTGADLDFHNAIMAAAGNPFITALFAPLVDLLFEVRRAASGARAGRETAIAAHARILDALRAGSPDAARDAMSTHMAETADRINEVIGQDALRLSLPPPHREPGD
jgi:GntR family transcriptional regulator, transcriptional repressor for pyruvate dehydrogenase complex